MFVWGGKLAFTLFHVTSFLRPLFKQPDHSPTEQDDRTPGRLQAVWPPPKTKDTEEKVGLKYTEAGNAKTGQLPSNGSVAATSLLIQETLRIRVFVSL